MATEALGGWNEALTFQRCRAQDLLRTGEGERLTRAILNRLKEYG
jgi:hypothetical protein